MMNSADSAEARLRLNWPVSSSDHEVIGRLWLEHSAALDNRDLEGLLGTLTPDCVVQVVPTGQRWEGQPGARAFYASLFSAFPDFQHALQHIVIGPQGVFEAARITGTHLGVWAGIAPTNRPVALSVQAYFPWHPAQCRFEGQTIYFDRGEMDELLLSRAACRG